MPDLHLNLWLDNLSLFLKSNIGSLCFIPLYALWVTLLLPGVWASMLAGVLYGTIQGTILVFAGASLGAITAFFLGRTLFRDWIEIKIKSFPKLQILRQTISKEGIRLIILTRLSPAFPFSLLNFVYGLSEVKFRDYLIGLFAILPGTVFFCSLGALAGEVARFGEILANRESSSAYLLNFSGILATIAVLYIVNRSLRKAFQDSDFSE